MIRFFLFVALLPIFFIPLSTSFAESSSVFLESYEVNYIIENGNIDSITLNSDFLQLIITMQTNDDGTLEINIPRSLLDAKFESNDDIFFVLVDGFETNYVEISSDSNSRTLVIPFFGGDSVIEIIGTTALNPIDENFELKIPEWIKDSAGWWADGKIDDTTFVTNIQYLINEGVMTIPPTVQEGTNSNEIPEWVKERAGRWAADEIGVDTFVTGIQYLIKEGIIIV